MLSPKQRKYLTAKRREIHSWFLTGKQEYVVQVNDFVQKKLIFQEIQDPLYNGRIQATARSSRQLLLTKTQEIQQPQRNHTRILNHKNFRTVIEIIKEADCPVLMHNGTLDILYTVHHLWQRLPEKLEDFKTIFNQMWGNVVDTKYLVKSHPVLKVISLCWVFIAITNAV